MDANKALAAAKRLPAPEKTGDTDGDEERMAQHELFVEMVQGILLDRSHVMPLYRKFKERIAAKLPANVPVNPSEYFAKISTVGALCRDEAAFVVAFLVSISDLSSANITDACAHVGSSVSHLLQFAVGLKEDLKLLPQLRLKDVMRRFLKTRADELGNRLADFKARGGLKQNGGLDWSRGVYHIVVADGKITKVRHHGSNAEVDLAQYDLTNAYNLEGNWCDYKACLRKDPLPPVYVHTFFGRLVGPHARQHWSAKSPTYANTVTQCHREWQTEKSRTENHASAETKAAMDQVSKYVQNKRSAAMAGAREKAREAAEIKRRRTLVNL